MPVYMSRLSVYPGGCGEPKVVLKPAP